MLVLKMWQQNGPWGLLASWSPWISKLHVQKETLSQLEDVASHHSLDSTCVCM